MVGAETIEVPERGGVRISSACWKELSQETSFWRLVDEKIVTVSLPENGSVRLGGTSYVGKVFVGNNKVSFVEKVPGAFRSLCIAAWNDNPKILDVQAAGGREELTFNLLLRIFAGVVEGYVRQYRDVKYATRNARGCMIGGKLDVMGTIRLRARGVRHHVAYQKSEISGDTNRNLIICAALLEVERLASQVKLDSHTISRFRKSLMAFGASTPQVRGLGRRRILEIASNELRSSRRLPVSVSDVLDFSLLILAGGGFGGDEGYEGRVRKSWFVNLETLFEAAVRNTMMRVLDGAWDVARPDKPPRILVDAEGRYPANTDIVISRRGVDTVICDAKYKVRKAFDWPLASELHEVLSHASAYGARKALIICPGDDFWSRRVGCDRNACEVWAFGVSVLDLERDIRRVCTEIGCCDPVVEQETHA